MIEFKMKHRMTTVLSHEFMHALGFNHEQQRGDQDQNVHIHYGWFHIFFLAKFPWMNKRLKPALRKY